MQRIETCLAHWKPTILISLICGRICQSLADWVGTPRRGVRSRPSSDASARRPYQRLAHALLICLMMNAIALAGAEPPLVTLRTRDAAFAISSAGSLCELLRNADHRSYLATNQPAPLLSVRVAGKLHAPDSATWEPQTKTAGAAFWGGRSERGADGRGQSDARGV